MDVTDLIQLAGQFGPIGLIVAYLIWRERAEQQIKRDETASRERLAVALNTLSLAITGRPHV